MNTVRQLIRQPFRLLCGIVMTALAVAALTVCLGQMLASRSAEQKLEDTFHTTALLTDAFQYEEDVITFPDGSEYRVRIPIYVMPEEISSWLEQTAAEHPETVKLLADHGLASAYIPALTMDNYTAYPPDGTIHISNGLLDMTRGTGTSAFQEPTPFGTPFDCTMFEITLTEAELYQYYGLSFLTMTGTIHKVISLQEGFPDPTGFTLRMSFRLSDSWDPETLALETGRRYLVYGTQYYDLDWALRHEIMRNYKINEHKTIHINSFDPGSLHLYDDWTLEKYESYGTPSYSVGYYDHEGEHITISNLQYDQMRTAYLKLDSARNYGETAAYEIPSIVPLDGTAEEYLASPEGALWQKTLEQMEVNHHAFPVLGVDKLGYVGEFARENARIVEGRDFTPEELSSGARVCVISETVAASSGLKPGDTVSVRYYDPDRNSPYQSFLENGPGTTNPAAYRYGATTPFAGDAEEYTVVGLYRYSNAWASPEGSPYAFTPNTVFVPKTAVSGEMSYAKQAVFRTVVLHNGTLPEFMAIAEAVGYEDLFVYHDQGYHAAAQSVARYQIVAARAALVGAVVYGIILMLFLLLFPGRQGKHISIMSALGADRLHRIGHILLESLCILLAGTIFGTIGGAALWDAVVDALLASAEVTLELELGTKGYIQIGGGQLAVAMFLTLLLAVPMTKTRHFKKQE